MEYDLLKYRGLQTYPDMESMKLLYLYGKYKKDRENARNQQTQNNSKVTRAF